MLTEATTDILAQRVVELELTVRHLTNELTLTKAEHEEAMRDYFDIFTNMEKKVEERTRQMKALQEQIAQSNRELQLMLDSSPGIIFYKDSQARYLRVNRRFGELFGVNPADVVGKTHEALFPGNNGDVLICTTEQLAKAEPILNQTGVIDTIEGRKTVLVNKIPYRDAQNRFAGVIGFTLDITDLEEAEKEKQKLEERIARSEKMEAIGTLAGGIAHDFNNILSAIIGYTELARMQITDDNGPGRYLDQVMKASQRAKSLVEQILTFSRQGQQELLPMLMEPIVKEALKLLRSSLPTTIEIRQNLSRCPTVLADATQVHQVLINLCTNAFHAMEAGGILEVVLKPVIIEMEDTQRFPELQRGQHVMLSVSDTGCGIDPVTIAKIFEPYFTTKQKGKGTGLGLAVVHGIVQKHGGAIRVYSEPGKGTTFHVYLPAVQEACPQKTEEPLPIPTGSETILLVDDEEALVVMAREMLNQLGYKVVTRSSSVEALALFTAKPDTFDLVITDMTMPKLTGDKFASQIKAIRPHVPVILCTGFSDRIGQEQAKAMGIESFLMKPLLPSDLARTVRRVIDECRSR